MRKWMIAVIAMLVFGVASVTGLLLSGASQGGFFPETSRCGGACALLFEREAAGNTIWPAPTPTPAPSLRFALLLPALMGLMAGWLFLTSARTMWRGDKEAETLAKKLGFTTWPSTMALRAALYASAILLFWVTLGLIGLIIFPGVAGS